MHLRAFSASNAWLFFPWFRSQQQDNLSRSRRYRQAQEMRPVTPPADLSNCRVPRADVTSVWSLAGDFLEKLWSFALASPSARS